MQRQSGRRTSHQNSSRSGTQPLRDEDRQSGDGSGHSQQSVRRYRQDDQGSNDPRTISQAGDSHRSLVRDSRSNKRRLILIEAAVERARLKRRLLENRDTVELHLINERTTAMLKENEGSVVSPRESVLTRNNRTVQLRFSEMLGENNMGGRNLQDWIDSVAAGRASPNSHLDDRHLPKHDPPASTAQVPDSRFGDVLMATLRTLQEVTANGINSSRLVNRFTTAKYLPLFSRDSLEWVRFMRAFETSSKLGGYSEVENIIRLYEALKGNAKEAVESSMVTNANSENIMKTLELRFGN